MLSIKNRWNGNISEDQVFMAYIKAIISFKFLSTPFDHSWIALGWLMQRSGLSWSLNLVMYFRL